MRLFLQDFMQVRLIEVAGKDAAEFLHRVTAGKVRGIAVGEGAPGLFLTGQSRMIAQFDLLRVEDARFLLASPLSCSDDLAVGLENLHFAEDLEIKLTEQQAGARATGESSARPERFPLRTPFAWPSPVPGYEFVLGGSPGEDWNFARIGALVPWPPSDWNKDTPALEAGVLPSIDRFKGCYPGQEVVELSLNVGHPVRLLIAVEAEQAIGDTISWDGMDLPVTSRAQQGATTRALVRVPWAKRAFLPAGFRKLAAHW